MMRFHQFSETADFDGIAFQSYDITFESQDELAVPIPYSEDYDAVMTVEPLQGGVEIQTPRDQPLEELPSTPGGVRAYNFGQNVISTLTLGLFSTVRARVRVHLAFVKRKARALLTSFPCRFCKFAIRIIATTVFGALGVPILPSGDYDLRAHQKALQGVMPDIINKVYGEAVAYLAGLLPNGLIKEIANVFSLLNWIVDLTDKILEAICSRLGLCPPAQVPPAPPASS